MKHISILVPDGQANLTTVACIVGAYEIFTRANEYWKENGRKEIFNVQLVGVSKKVDFSNRLLTIHPHIHIGDVAKTNLVVIPSLDRDFRQAANGNRELVEWFRLQYKSGAEIAAMCTGAFMLASSGLLDGKDCSTHWSAADMFRTFFPKVTLRTEKLITDEHGLYTNGGGYSFLNLLIYLVEKYYDRRTAIFCSKIFQVEIDRQSQSAFTIFKGQMQHGDEVVKEAQAYIESRVVEKISMEQLSSRFAVGRRNFDRRFIKATGNTPLEYVQRVKIEAAKKAFETTRKTINEVMYEVGYNDQKAFREVFKKITGISPLVYRGKYNKDMAE